MKNQKFELSIVIPTFNEEKYLPILLKSLNQNLKKIKAEVIIVDSPKTTDKTVSVARKSHINNLRILKPEKSGQSYQRNYGGDRAMAPLILFLDADVILPNDFLAKALKEIKSRQLDIASTYSKTGKIGLWEKLVYRFANVWMHFFEKIKPYGQCCFFIKADLHKKIQGFDETLYFGEDSEYIERAAKAGGKFGILKNVRFIISARAFSRYGRAGQTAGFFFLNLYRLIGRERRKEKSTSEIYEKFTKISPTRIEGKIKKVLTS